MYAINIYGGPIQHSLGFAYIHFIDSHQEYDKVNAATV